MKIQKQVCTIKQMQILEKLGFDISKASMAWLHWDNDDDDEWMVAIHNDDCYELSAETVIPTYSIGDMLEMLPKKIHSDDYECVLCIGKYDSNWSIDYRGEDYDDYYYVREVYSKNLRDALVAELKLLKENKEI